MKRISIEYLQKWYTRTDRKPLLVRGARQVGKTWLIRDLARTLGVHLIEINFELNPAAKVAFNSLQPSDIIKSLALIGYPSIESGKVLLFLDEIQECPQAITALRYFYELRPDIAVIGTGSLLEFAIEAGHLSIPVGRVEYFRLFPMNFVEYLFAKGNAALAAAIESFDSSHIDWPEAAHDQALFELRNYLFCGGMPEALKTMCEGNDVAACRRAHLSIWQGYRQDFYKYASKINAALAEKLFIRSPGQVGGRFKYVQVDPDTRAAEVKNAVMALERAGVIRRVFHTSGQGLPLATDCNERIAKLFMLDVGLMHAALQIDAQLVQEQNLLAIHRGAVAEQFAAQEMVSSMPADSDGALYFWVREARSSQAEVDFLIAAGSTVLPVEVKSGSAGTLKSLWSFLDSHPASPRGVRLSMDMPSVSARLITLPLYLAGTLYKLK